MKQRIEFKKGIFFFFLNLTNVIYENGDIH